jgi:hypothetical protein
MSRECHKGMGWDKGVECRGRHLIVQILDMSLDFPRLLRLRCDIDGPLPLACASTQPRFGLCQVTKTKTKPNLQRSFADYFSLKLLGATGGSVSPKPSTYSYAPMSHPAPCGRIVFLASCAAAPIEFKFGRPAFIAGESRLSSKFSLPESTNRTEEELVTEFASWLVWLFQAEREMMVFSPSRDIRFTVMLLLLKNVSLDTHRLPPVDPSLSKILLKIV